MFCHQCGNEIEGYSRYCPKCGSQITPGIGEPNSSSHNIGMKSPDPEHNKRGIGRIGSKFIFIVLLAVFALIFASAYFSSSSTPTTDSGDPGPQISTLSDSQSQISKPKQAPSVTSVSSAPLSISVSQIVFSNMRLSCFYDPGTGGAGVFPNCGTMGFALKGQLTNNSSIPFQGVYMTIKAYDCPSTTVNSNCTKIGQDTSAMLIVGSGVFGDRFMPDETQEASDAAIHLGGIPPIQGNFEWTYSVNQCTGNSLLYCGFWDGQQIVGHQNIQATQ